MPLIFIIKREEKGDSIFCFFYINKYNMLLLKLLVVIFLSTILPLFLFTPGSTTLALGFLFMLAIKPINIVILLLLLFGGSILLNNFSIANQNRFLLAFFIIHTITTYINYTTGNAKGFNLLAYIYQQ